MDDVSRNAILERIEDTLSYILSRKYDCNVRIYLKKDGITNGDEDTSDNIREE